MNIEEPTEDRNMTASIAISSAATLVIATGASMLSNDKYAALGFIIVGVAIYFLKAYLYNKGCL